MNISARNKFVGQVSKITSGSVNSEVVIALSGGGEIVSVITKTSAKSLKLKKARPSSRSSSLRTFCWSRHEQPRLPMQKMK